MSVRDTVPTANRQATMALRYHAADGNLKWVSLLLWAGADPRLPVPRLEIQTLTRRMSRPRWSPQCTAVGSMWLSELELIRNETMSLQ